MNWILKSNYEILQEIGNRLRKNRLNINMTQGEIASRVGMSIQTVQKIENGLSVGTEYLIMYIRAIGTLESLENFIPTPSISPTLVKKIQKPERLRASKKHK